MSKNVQISTETTGRSSEPNPAPTASRRLLRLWVVDDNPALRELFAQLLSRQPGFQCRRQFASAEAVLAALAEERPPDFILIDVNLSGQSGLDAIRPIKQLAPSVKVLVMTMFTNTHYEVEAFKAGASGFLLKSYEVDEIISLIQLANRSPGAPQLFPNLALNMREEFLSQAKGGRPAPKKAFGLMGAFNALCRRHRRHNAR